MKVNPGNDGDYDWKFPALSKRCGRISQNRELITTERCRTENIDDVKMCTS
jgi:hypothetical protein